MTWAERKWKQIRYPTGVHGWRWRFLGLWLVVFTLIVSWSLHRQGVQADHAHALAERNRVTNFQQERTIRTLCDDLYIVNGLTQTALSSVRLRRADNIKRGLEAQVVADTYLIRNFELYSAQILDQLTSKESPCVSP